MNTAILACNTIADELASAMNKTASTYPIHWIDSKLHIKPERLKEELQSKIDGIQDAETIILAFGLCGNGLLGLTSRNARLVIPRTEDCISLLLGSQKRRTALMSDAPRYYLTKGWLESPNSIAEEYQYCVNRFGRQKGLNLMRTMLKEYRYFTFVETYCYDSSPYIAKSKSLARKLGMAHQIIDGSDRFFKKLLSGPWDDEFIILQPGQSIQLGHFFPNRGQASPDLSVRR